MSAASPAPSPRRRGRRAASAGDARAEIVAAAAHDFAAHGYDGASLRGIARRARVDPSLVHHYFDDKASLFAEAMQVPVRPDVLVRNVLAGPRDEIGANLVRAILAALDPEPAHARAIQLMRTALGHEFAARMIRQFILREVLHRIADGIGGDDAALRATLAASQVVGLMLVRYGVAAEPLASAPVDEVVRRIGPVLQLHLVGEIAGS